MEPLSEFVPKSYLCFRQGYSLQKLKKDFFAGITVGFISLPLAMAFAIASGTSPDRGLFTAIIAGFLISILGGSRVQIGGPTGAFIVLIYGIVERSGYEGLAISTLIAAIILVLLGIFRLGSWIKYVPHPLIVGFTTALAVIIFSTQVKDFFGLKMESPPADFLEKWSSYIHAFPSFDPLSLAVGASTLGLIFLLRRFTPRIPWGIAAIFFATAVCYVFSLPIETIHSKFGGIPHNLPLPRLPSFSIAEGRLGEMLFNGLSIAFLGAVESLLCCVIADGMMGSRHKSNCELVGQGIANFASILFGGLPATGAVARTATNVKTGAETPVAGIIHAATLFACIAFFSPVVSQIPLAALAAVLMMVAWNMSELGHFLRLFKSPKGDIAILLTAFFLTLFVDITAAITFGMVLASFIFMKRMSAYSKALPLERADPEVVLHRNVPEGVKIYEMEGPLFFGAADLFRDMISSLAPPPKVFILRMCHVPMVDASGMEAMKEFFKNCRKEKTVLIISGLHPETQKKLDAFGVLQLIGKNHIFPNLDSALAGAAALLKD